ncbi:FecR domain-containing protein [Halobacteriovorax sp.]|uniref:FecR family protein n=1 Tax=Halobacteriovorax sp. TaxID=2020862 RepID=UPI0035680EED
MRIIIIIFTLNILILNSFGEDIEIGQIIILKGEAHLLRNNNKTRLQEKSLINELDIISTAEKSLIKISFVDNTNLILGPKSELKIQQFSKKDRINIFNFLRGNFRVKVQEKVKLNQKLEFLSNYISVGVRGTEFLANSYISKSTKVSDVALLEGTLNTSIEKAETFTLKAGEVVNTSTYSISKEIKRLDQKLLEELLKDELKLLPNILEVTASIMEKMNNNNSSTNSPTPSLPVIGAVMGVATASPQILGSKSSDEEKSAKEKRKLIIKEKSNLKNEPWDIRDAMIRKKELRADNVCFYWFYKSLPGSGELERFRRERDCDEYENDL